MLTEGGECGSTAKQVDCCCTAVHACSDLERLNVRGAVLLGGLSDRNFCATGLPNIADDAIVGQVTTYGPVASISLNKAAIHHMLYTEHMTRPQHTTLYFEE